MRVIDHRHFAKKLPGKRNRRLLWGVIGLSSIVVLFVIANIAVASMYRGKVLPRTMLEQTPIGGQKVNDLEKTKLANAQNFIILKDDTKIFGLYLKDVGLEPDWAAIKKQTEKHGWFPLLSLLKPQRISMTYTSNKAVLEEKVKVLNTIFGSPAIPAHITYENGVFREIAAVGASEIDANKLIPLVKTTINKKKREVLPPYKHAAPPVSVIALAPLVAGFQKSLETKIIVSHGAKSRQVTKTEIGNLYIPAENGQSMQVNAGAAEALVQAIAKEFGITLVNTTASAAALSRGVTRNETTSIALVATTDAVVRRYCTAVRGVDASVLGELQGKLAAVYSDPRGWGLGGHVAFTHTASGCDYTVWLSAATSMTSFGGVCDSYYSCRSGNNVVINYDRWTGATDPWNAAGGSLEDYRVMVINHETGHWLGFGHATCPGTGQPAPVMQQQSISLGGCTFNPWPTVSETSTLKQTLGLR